MTEMVIHYFDGRGVYCNHPLWAGRYDGSSKAEEVTCGLCLARMERESKLEKARELQSQGLSQRSIAERLGVSVATVSRYLDE